MGEKSTRIAVLRYKGCVYRLHRVVLLGGEAVLVRWLKSKKKWKAQRLYPGSGGYSRWKVMGRWVTASLSVQHSFATGKVDGLLACHAHGALRHQVGLDACSLGTAKENRAHREIAGTRSTGSDTIPGKLIRSDVLKMLEVRRTKNKSTRKLAAQFNVSRQTILYHLRQNGFGNSR
jgi:hypothetical protein